MKRDKGPKGALGFDQEYWNRNYSQPDEMDGIGNVVEHVLYLKYLFGVELIDINSVIDLGFGLGHMLKEFVFQFKPYKVMGVEPSKWAYQKLKKEDLQQVQTTKVELINTDLRSWCQNQRFDKATFDLGICTSVFQYLSKEELEEVIPVLAKRVKYLYLSVPTDQELKRQRQEAHFHDTYALCRSRSFYNRLLRPSFTVVSQRLLESKIHFDQSTTFFTDLFYRF